MYRAPVSPATDATFTMRPHPLSIIPGSRARVQGALRAVRKDLAVIWKAAAQPDTAEDVFAAIIEKPWFDYAPLMQYTGDYACAPRTGRR